MHGFSTINSDEGAVAGLARRHTREPMNQLIPEKTRRIKIGFVGLAAGAGTTTLAFAAAEYIAASPAKQKSGKMITLLELDIRPDAPAGRPYDKIGIDRRFAGRAFASFYRLAAEGNPLQRVCNLDGGINWALRIPGEPGPAPSSIDLHRLLHNVSGDVILCDIPAQGFLSGAGAGGRETLLKLFADFDRIVCILDPLPSRLLASVPAAEVCRAAAATGVRTTYVFNKLNPGVNLREVTRFTGIRDYIPFPAISAKTVYAAEYACHSLAAEPEIKTALHALLA